MDINYNTLNGLIIFIVILLFIPFTQYNYNNILGYTISVLLFLSILGFLIVKKWINLSVCLYLFFAFRDSACVSLFVFSQSKIMCVLYLLFAFQYNVF